MVTWPKSLILALMRQVDLHETEASLVYRVYTVKPCLKKTKQTKGQKGLDVSIILNVPIVFQSYGMEHLCKTWENISLKEIQPTTADKGFFWHSKLGFPMLSFDPPDTAS